jgi:hypothetical protein
VNAPEPVQRQTKTGALIAYIKGLGTDKMFKPIGIRTTALAEATGVPVNSIQMLLEPAVKNGTLVVCKITNAKGVQEREYRAGPGVPPPEFKPLKVKPAWPDLTRPAARKAPLTPLSTPKPDTAPIVTPVFIKPTQPEVVEQAKETPAAEARPPMRAAPAVAAQATPKPAAGAELKKEPAARKASAGDDVRIGINAEGTLVIAIDDESLELDIYQTLKLGDFLHATQGVWRP